MERSRENRKHRTVEHAITAVPTRSPQWFRPSSHNGDLDGGNLCCLGDENLFV